MFLVCVWVCVQACVEYNFWQSILSFHNVGSKVLRFNNMCSYLAERSHWTQKINIFSEIKEAIDKESNPGKTAYLKRKYK